MIRRVLVATLVLAPLVASADQVFLKPSGKLQGTVVSEDENSVTIKLDAGGTTRVEKKRIVRIVKTESPAPASAPKTAPLPPATLPREKAAPSAVAPTTSKIATKPSTSTSTSTTSPSTDSPDEKWLVPPAARLGDPSTLPRVAGLEKLRQELDALIATGEPVALEGFVREKAKTREEQDLVLRAAQLCADEPRRLALFAAWLEVSGKPDTAEERLLPLARSDVELARFTALRFLATCATWGRSLPALLALLDLPHEESRVAARAVVEALAKRSTPDSEVAQRILDRFAKNENAETRASYAVVLGLVADAGKGRVVPPLRDAYAKASEEGKAELLSPLLRALGSGEAHRLVLEILSSPARDASAAKTRGRLAQMALAELPHRGGSFEDVPLVLSYLDVQGFKDRALVALSLLGHRPRFKSREDAERWWASVEGVFERRATLVQDMATREKALDAMTALRAVFAPEVAAAFRATARSAATPALRLAAAQSIVARGERKGGVAAILDALDAADEATREPLRDLLQGLAGSTLPEDARAWWREQFPDDFEE